MFRRWLSFFLLMTLPLSATIDKIPIMAPDSFGCHKPGFCYLTRDGVASEKFPNGVTVTTVRSEDKITISIGDLGSIEYRFEAAQLTDILRKDTLGTVVYQSRLEYSPEGFLLSEGLIGGLGEMQHRLEDGLYSCITPYTQEEAFLPQGFCETITYSGLTHEKLSRSDLPVMAGDRYEAADAIYDQEGRLSALGQTTYRWNERDLLMAVESPEQRVEFAYDHLGRRISKTVFRENFFDIESYVYWGIHEIASFDAAGNLKFLRVPTLSAHRELCRPCAIETPQATYAAVPDIRGNLLALIDIQSGEAIDVHPKDVYGADLLKGALVPWIFSGKRYDPETGLCYFPYRYYAPQLGRWISIDPCACEDEEAYVYCDRDPLRYFDPDGRSVAIGIVIPLGVALSWEAIELTLWCAGGAIVGTIAGWWYGTQEEPKQELQKNTEGVPLPDRTEPLPLTDPTGEPHSIEGRNKAHDAPPYPQTREYDAAGNPVRDIDYTDHNDPAGHPNPHEHEWKWNERKGKWDRGYQKPVFE